MRASSTATHQQQSAPTTSRPPGVSVIPEDGPSAKAWIQENPVLTAIIVIVVLLFVIVVILYCIRRKRKSSSSKDVNLNETESQSHHAPQTETPLGSNAPDNVLPESFVIIQSPILPRPQKRKSTLAVPPAFSVSHTHRKSAPSVSQDLRRSIVGWSRWSTAGLEIHTSPPPEENPFTKMHARKKRQSTSGIMMAVPVVYRRKSQGHLHAVYAPENLTPPPPRPKTP